MNDEHVKLYQPDAQLRMGWFSLSKEMLNELIGSRELIWRLFLRDFLGRYKQSFFGVAWALVLPLVAVGTFVFLNRAGILNIGDTGIPYPIFALVGLTIWQIFATGLTSCSNSIVQGGSMVVKINFPKESLVIASLGQTIFEFIVRVGLLIIVFAVYQYIPAWTTIFFPLALIPLILLTLGLGFILSLLNAIMRDVTNILTLLTTFLLFLTPVLYPPPQSELFIALNRLNPLTPLINEPRNLLLFGHLSQPTQFFWISLFTIFFFIATWRIFHLVETKIPERV